MDAKKELAHKFHQNLGKLFYAIAAIDNNVRVEELDRLEEIIKKEWLTSDLIEDDFKTAAEDAITNTFKWLHHDNEYNAKTCYNSFLSFKKQHESLFTDNMNRLILKTARAIATSFSKVNKSELMILAKLSMELNK